MNGPTPRAGLREMGPYVSPQLAAPVRLNTNESPHPLPEDFSRMLASTIGDLSLHRYPDPDATRLREELASLHGHPVDGTWAANGSNEILAQLLLAYGGPGRRAMVFEPTYQLHARLARITHTEVTAGSLDEGFALGDAQVREALEAAPDIVFVCSPNNPTGNAQSPEAVATIADGSVSTLVIVDEAYIDIGGRSALPLVGMRPNVAIVRTFSKAFALAGARVGYLLADPQVVRDVEVVRLPYHLSTLTQATALAALHHRAEAVALIDQIRAQRDRLIKELGAMPGVEVYPSDANFVLFAPPSDASDVWSGLIDRGVLVRDVSAAVPNALRVTAGTEHEIDLFLSALEEVLAR